MQRSSAEIVQVTFLFKQMDGLKECFANIKGCDAFCAFSGPKRDSKINCIKSRAATQSKAVSTHICARKQGQAVASTLLKTKMLKHRHSPKTFRIWPAILVPSTTIDER